MSRRFSDFCPKSWRLNQSSCCLSASYCACNFSSAVFVFPSTAYASLSATPSRAFSCSSLPTSVADNVKLLLALNTTGIYQLSHRSGSLPVAFPLAYNLDIHAFHQRQQCGAIQLSFQLLRTGVGPRLIIANEDLHGEGAPHCQGTTLVFDTIARAETTRDRIGGFGRASAASEWLARRTAPIACRSA